MPRPTNIMSLLKNTPVMLRILTLTVLASTFAISQESIPWTLNKPASLERNTISVDARFNTLGIVPGTHDVWLPDGWKANIFFAGSQLNKPRFLGWGPDSVLFVANMSRNNVLALPDANRDGIADTAIVAASVPAQTSSIFFVRDTMYTGSESGIRKYWRSSGSGLVFDKVVTIVNKSGMSSQLGGNHRTRTVVVDTMHNKLYVSIGSKGNATRDAERALIEEYNLDGSNRSVYATGTRNAVGLMLHPRTGRLWANNNGSDQQGDDIPPEWVDMIRPGGFYGYPFAYHVNNWFNFNSGDYAGLLPITSSDSALAASMVPPAALVTAHSAPMQLVFSHQRMSPAYRTGAFMALRGSWNRSPVSGTKLVYLDFDNDEDTIANYVTDFCTGFLIDSTNSASRWARPVGVALAADGSIYLSSDDLKQFILRLVPPVPSSVRRPATDRSSLYVYPNPATKTELYVTNPTELTAIVVAVNQVGQSVAQWQIPAGTTPVSIERLSSGVYTLVCTNNGYANQTLLQVIR